jgi:glycerol-3-phosphate dehydrogenase
MILTRYIEETQIENFDAIIIGGGITGAAVAYTAAESGLKIALFEKKDFGGATSAATSKLIHGGLRYLANMEFKLVRESLHERRILGNIAPNFVYPLPFLFPNYKRWRGNMWKLAAGMVLYDILSFDKQRTWDKSKRLPNHKTITYSAALKREPNLISDKLRNATVFYDYQSIFPERLTLAFVKSAVEYGAKVSNYSEVVDFIYYDKNTVSGVLVKDNLNDRIKEIKAPLIINCGGTWADIILAKASKNQESGHKVKRSEGIHIITKKIAGDHVVSLQKKDGGHLMIMPWRGHSLIGTTDKEYFGNPDDYQVSQQSLDEIISGVNEHFGFKISMSDIKHAYGGLRPLLDNQTKGTYGASRKYEVYDNAADGINGLITVEGGKYTTSRNLAKHVMEIVETKTGKKLRETFTNKNYLSGCDIKNIGEFMLKQHQLYKDFEQRTVEFISRNYGTESSRVFEIARENPHYREIVSLDGEILAEVVYAVRFESAKTLKDIMLRRTGIGTLGKPATEITQEVLNLASELLHWNQKRQNEELDSLMKVYDFPKQVESL